MSSEKKGRVIRLFALGLILLLLAALVFLALRERTDAPDDGLRITELSDPEDMLPLRSGSIWSGLLSVSDHRGKGILEDGIRPIRGELVKSDLGTCLELYDDAADDSEPPILSLWVRLQGNTLYPLISGQNARFFQILLEETDKDAFTMRMESGTLGTEYFYDDGSESCLIRFRIRQEK